MRGHKFNHLAANSTVAGRAGFTLASPAAAVVEFMAKLAFEKLVLVLGIVKTVHEYCYWYWVLLRTPHKIGVGIGYC